jgi:hypothetical protein
MTTFRDYLDVMPFQGEDGKLDNLIEYTLTIHVRLFIIWQSVEIWASTSWLSSDIFVVTPANRSLVNRVCISIPRRVWRGSLFKAVFKTQIILNRISRCMVQAW